MTADECRGCPFPDSVAALELVRLREGIGRLAEFCWTFRSDEVRCVDLIDGTFPNGGEWTREMCCLPCQLRALLDDQGER